MPRKAAGVAWSPTVRRLASKPAVALATREFDLLQYLAEHQGLALSRRQLLDGVRADGLREIAQGLAGKVVVARGERAVAGVGDDIRLGGAAAAPG